MDETQYTIPLREAFDVPRTRRASKAVKVVREFLIRHTKAKNIVLDSSVNDALWERGIKKPPRRIKVTVTTEDGNAIAVLTK